MVLWRKWYVKVKFGYVDTGRQGFYKKESISKDVEFGKVKGEWQVGQKMRYLKVNKVYNSLIIYFFSNE